VHNKAYNTTWFTDNELSQITPMPKAWDVTASGASDCTATVSDCATVYACLDSQSRQLSSWAWDGAARHLLLSDGICPESPRPWRAA
jgi:peptide/nickel transport system substrate-binding protein